MTVKVGDKIVVACDDYTNLPRGSIAYVTSAKEDGSIYAIKVETRFEFWLEAGDYTPYIESVQEPALQQLADMGQAFDAAPDADGWITHDGSAKRPKGVGKRDEGEFWYIGGAIERRQAQFVNWQHIHSYRVTKRAEKRRKVWVVYGSYGFEVFAGDGGETLARGYMKVNGGKLYTAKLKEVTE